MTEADDLIRAHKQVEQRRRDERDTHILTMETLESLDMAPGKPDLWCHRVKHLIETATLAEAGAELSSLLNYALKTQHSEQFGLEVKGCLLMFWERCLREQKNAIERTAERIAQMKREAGTP